MSRPALLAARRGGVEPTAAPLAAATVDFNADSIAAADNASVSGPFADDTGNGHTCVSLGSAFTFKVAVANGHDAIRTTDGTEGPGWGDLSALFPSAATLIVLATVPENYTLFHTGIADEFWHHGSGSSYIAPFRTARQDFYPVPPVPTSGTHIFTLRSSASKYEMRVDGVAAAGGIPSYSAGSVHRIGRAGDPFVGDISRVLLFDSSLVDADCLAWEAAIA